MSTRILAATAIFLAISSNDVIARQWFVEPELFIAGGWDDNPYLEVDDESTTEEFRDQSFADFGGRIRLGSESDSDLIAFDADVSALRYDNNLLDTDRILASALYEKTGLVNSFRVELGVLESSSLEDFTRSAGVTSPTDVTPITPFGRTQEDVDRSEIFFLPTFTSILSSNWTAELGLGYRDVEYDDPLGTGSYTDFEEYVVFTELRRLVSERMSFFGIANFQFNRPKDFGELGDIEKEDAASLFLGLDYVLNPQLTTTISAGPGYVNTEIVSPDGLLEFSDTSPVFNVSFDFTGQRTTTSLSFSDYFETYGDGGITKTQSATLRISRPETLGGLFSFTAAYSSRDPVLTGSVISSTRDYFALSPSISWDMNRYLSLFFDIIYREQDTARIDIATNLESIDTGNSTAYRIGARYDWGRKLIKR